MSDVKSPADTARQKAEQRFRVSEQRRTDAEKVMSDLAVAKNAEREKTVRLRALRLAKEEEDRLAEAAAAAARAALPKSTRRTKPRVDASEV